MSDIEHIVQAALTTGELNLTFQGVKQEVVKLSMEIHGERKAPAVWDLHVRLGDGTTWSRLGLPERELLTTIKSFHGVFAKMGKERARA